MNKQNLSHINARYTLLAAKSDHVINSGGAGWQDLDISGDIPKGSIAVINCSTAGACGVRMKGTSQSPTFTTGGVGPWEKHVPVDAAGKIQVYYDNINASTYSVIAYISGFVSKYL